MPFISFKVIAFDWEKAKQYNYGTIENMIELQISETVLKLRENYENF